MGCGGASEYRVGRRCTRGGVSVGGCGARAGVADVIAQGQAGRGGSCVAMEHGEGRRCLQGGVCVCRSGAGAGVAAVVEQGRCQKLCPRVAY